jgi:peptidylprolyl isomerase
VPIKSLRRASSVPAAERTDIEVLRDDRPVFAQFVEARRNRSDAWYLRKAGHIDVCNIAVPVRDAPKTGSN